MSKFVLHKMDKVRWHAIVSFYAIFVSFLVQGVRASEGPSLWQLLSIAPISGFVGYITNVLALKMTFFPVEFFGIKLLLLKNQPFGLFGWQGIIPSKSGKMAGIAVDLMVGKLIDVKKVFQRLDPHEMSKVLEPGMRETMKKVVDDLAQHEIPKAWEDLPQYIQKDCYRKMVDLVPEFFQALLEDVQENIYDVFDIRDFAVRRMTLDKRLTNDIFMKVGAKEFRFIEYSGFVFGFLFGLIQTLIYVFYDEDWVLPAAGFIVGWATNWLALKMIFEPIEPIYIGKIKIQGLFFKRQQEVAAEFARMSSDNIFTPDRMWDEILYGPLAYNFEAYIRKHARRTTSKLLQSGEVPLRMYLSDAGFKALEDRIADKIIAEMPNVISLGYEYTQNTLRLEDELREKLAALPKDEFEGVLHPVFQEDEVKLILVGALLGLAVGFLQLYAFSKVV